MPGRLSPLEVYAREATYPPWYTRHTHHGIYRPPTLVYTPPSRLPVYTLRIVATFRCEGEQEITLLVRRLKKRGLLGQKRPLLTLRINLLPGPNLSIMDKKPATESTCVQGSHKYPNPSRSDLKPPSVSWPAFSVPRGEEAHPRPRGLFLTKCSRK